MLWSEKQVDNQVSMPPDPTQTSTPSNFTPSTFEDKSVEQVHKPATPFSNRLRSNNKAQMEKILEIFNQVKINVALLHAIQQVTSYAKFLKDICAPRKERSMYLDVCALYTYFTSLFMLIICHI